jgi:hypothetical protein
MIKENNLPYVGEKGRGGIKGSNLEALSWSVMADKAATEKLRHGFVTDV